MPRLAKALHVPTPVLRGPGPVWNELPGPAKTDPEPVGHVRLGYARASTARQSLDIQLDRLAQAGPLNRPGRGGDVSFRPGAWQRQQIMKAADLHGDQIALLDGLATWRST